MAIYSRNTVITESEINTDLPYVAPTAEAGMEIAYEMYSQLTQLESSVYIADLMIEDKVTEGFADPDILVENVLKDVADKAVEIFKALKAKIIGWWNSLKETMFKRFGDIGEFVKKYESEIKENAKVNPVTYNGYEYSGKDPFDAIKDKKNALSDHVQKIKTMKPDEVDALRSTLEVSNINTNTVFADIRSSDKKKDIKPDINFMITYIKNYKSHIDTINGDFKNLLKNIDDIIKDLQNSKSKDKDVNKNINAKISLYKLFSSNFQKIISVYLSGMSGMYTTFGGVLRAQLMKKPKKDSSTKESTIEVDTEGTNILESAMQML